MRRCRKVIAGTIYPSVTLFSEYYLSTQGLNVREKEPQATSTSGVFPGCVCRRFNLWVGNVYGVCTPSSGECSTCASGVCVPESMDPEVIVVAYCLTSAMSERGLS
jgi:hypothetical protein